MLQYFGYKNKIKIIASGIIMFFIILGIILLSLNILDIGESFRLHLPINLLNTIFISGLAMPGIYMSILCFRLYGSPGLLALGGAQLAFAIGNILKAWLPQSNLSVLIIVYESVLLLASLVFFTGGLLTVLRLLKKKPEFVWKGKVLIWFYSCLLIIISLIFYLVFQWIIPSSVSFGSNIVTVQDILQIVSILFLFSGFGIYLRICYRSRNDAYYWYFLGLLAFAFGVLFISQSPIEARLAWNGRLLQYLGNCCFLITVIIEFKRLSAKTPVQVIEKEYKKSRI
jgi:hypothetical protein